MSIFGFVLPSFCIGCGRPGYGLCHVCLSQLVPYPNHKNPNHAFYRYGRIPSLLLKKAKYKPNQGLLAYFLENIPLNMRFGLIDFVKRWPGPLLTYVPSHEDELRIRGYNQAETIARYVGREIRIPVVKLLKKTRINRKQSMLRSLGARQKNVENAYKVIDAHQSADRTIIVVDDVVTTGATVRTVTEELRHGGAGEVVVLSLFRAH